MWGSNPGSDEKFSSSPKHPNPLWGPLSLIFTGYVGSYTWVKLAGCQVGNSPASGAEVRNVWSCTSTPFILCVHDVNKDSVNFFTST